MINLKKIIFAATIAVASLGFSAASNAVLISHDIVYDSDLDAPDQGPQVVGQVSISVLENGAQSIGVDFVEEYVSFTFMGEEVDAGGFFLANFDGNDLYAGILDMAFQFDIAALASTIDGAYSTFNMGFNLLTVSDINDFNNILDEGLFTLGEATVVSEPSVLALFALALVGFGMRRRAQ